MVIFSMKWVSFQPNLKLENLLVHESTRNMLLKKNGNKEQI